MCARALRVPRVLSCAGVRAKRDAAVVVFVNNNVVLSSNFPSWFNPRDSNQVLANAQALGTDISSWYDSATPFSTGSAGGMVKVSRRVGQVGGRLSPPAPLQGSLRRRAAVDLS